MRRFLLAFALISILQALDARSAPLGGVSNDRRIQPQLDVSPSQLASGASRPVLLTLRNGNASYGASRGGSLPLRDGDTFRVTIGCADAIESLGPVVSSLAGTWDLSGNPATPYAGGSFELVFRGADELLPPDASIVVAATLDVAALPGPPCSDPLHSSPSACVIDLDAVGDGNFYPTRISTALLTGCADDLGASGGAGATGSTGATGPAGGAGATGATGPAGPAGAPGSNGATGAAGSTGPAGANGATGAMGPAGANGATGPAGSGGSTGPAGANGTNGGTGATGPGGAAGAAGSTGATGPAGAAGAAGSTGATGPSGAAGAAGSTGSTGPSGASGASGATGPTANCPTCLDGEVTFWTSTTTLSGDADLFFWDDANGRLGVGTVAPGVDLHVVGGSNAAGVPLALVDNGGLTGDAFRGATTAAPGAGTGSGVVGTTTQSLGQGVVGQHFRANGTGVLGVGNNVTGSPLNVGSGGAFFGSQFGAYVQALNGAGSSSTGILASANGATANFLPTGQGGAFNGDVDGLYVRAGGLTSPREAIYTDNNSGIVRVNYFDGTTQFKITGSGSVATNVDDGQGGRVILHCPEAPEVLFEDYGQARLAGGRAHVDIDPIFTRNVTVDDAHPLRVFVQLEGECNGVFVTNKSAEGFDVVELGGGRSATRFQWHVVANRADETLPSGVLSRYSDLRFAPALPDREVEAAEPSKAGLRR